MPLVLAAVAGCGAATDHPAAELRRGLAAYQASAVNEPIDERENMARMASAVRGIRRRGLVEAVPVLLDVVLLYDATDNPVAPAAWEAIVELAPRSLDAIDRRISRCRDGGANDRSFLPVLERLRQDAAAGGS